MTTKVKKTTASTRNSVKSKKLAKPVEPKSSTKPNVTLASGHQAVNVSSFYYFFIVLALTMPLGVLLRLIYSRYLTPTEMGSLYALIGFFGLLTIFVNYGFTFAMQYFIPRFRAQKDIISARAVTWYALSVQATLLIISSLVLIILRNTVLEQYFKGEVASFLFMLFLVYYIANNISMTFTDVLVSYNKVTYSQTIYLVQMLLLAGLSVLVVVLGPQSMQYEWLVLLWPLTMFLSVFGYAWYSYRVAPELFHLPVWKKPLFFELMGNATSAFVGNVSFSLLTRIDVVMITYFMTVGAVAHYTNVLTIVESVATLFTAFSGIIIPIVVGWYTMNKQKELSESLELIYTVFLYMIAPFMMVFGIFATQVLTILYGQQYVVDAGLLAFFSMFLIFRVLLQYNLAYLVALGKIKNMYKIVLPCLILNVILNYILIGPLGLVGVAIGTVTGWFVICIVTLIVVRRTINFVIPFMSLGKMILLLALFWYIVFAIRGLSLIGYYWIDAGITLLIGLIVYFTGGYMLGLYSLRKLYIFIPEQFKSKVQYIHQTYLRFLD